MFKRVSQRPPGWLPDSRVVDLYSVSHCISGAFADYIPLWEHNGYWLFDSPEVIRRIADSEAIDLSGTTAFYYEAFEREFDEESRSWGPFGPEPSFALSVQLPEAKRLEGFDVVSYSAGSGPECSPLSCNLLADRVAVNEHCLIRTFEEAKAALEQGQFDRSEPGPFRILAVHTL